MDIGALKDLIEESSGISSDAYHVILSVLVQLSAAALLRRSVAHPAPFVVVFALELINEWNDVTSEVWPAAARGMQWAEGAKDICLTLLLPAIILAVARWCPRILAETSKPSSD